MEGLGKISEICGNRESVETVKTLKSVQSVDLVDSAELLSL